MNDEPQMMYKVRFVHLWFIILNICSLSVTPYTAQNLLFQLRKVDIPNR